MSGSSGAGVKSEPELVASTMEMPGSSGIAAKAEAEARLVVSVMAMPGSSDSGAKAEAEARLVSLIMEVSGSLGGWATAEAKLGSRTQGIQRVARRLNHRCCHCDSKNASRIRFVSANAAVPTLAASKVIGSLLY